MCEMASSVLKAVLPFVLALGNLAPGAESGPECPDPLEIWYSPPLHIVDRIAVADALDVLGVCGEALVLCWGRSADDEAPGTRAIEGGFQGPSMLLGIDRGTGKVLWRRDAGYGSSEILWTEGERFWHLQQSCEISVFLVKRSAADGCPEVSIDFTSLPPLDHYVRQATVGSNLFAMFAEEVGSCKLDRHLHGKDLPGLTLLKAFRRDGTIWFFVSIPGRPSDQLYLCAASPVHTVWAWYSLTGNKLRLSKQGFGPSEEAEAQLPKEGRDDVWPAGLPEVAFEVQTLRDVDGRTYRVTTDFRRAEVSVTPIEGGTLRASERKVFTLDPPPRLAGEKEWDWSDYLWSPHLVIAWHSDRKLLIDLYSIPGKLAGRTKPFPVVEDEVNSDRFRFSCDGDEAVVGIGSRLVALTRKRDPESGRLDLRARPLRTPFLQGEAKWDVALKGLMKNAGRVYATFHLVRQKEKEWQDRWLATGWRAGEEAPAWVQEIK